MAGFAQPRRRHAAQRSTLEAAHLPAPVGGINTISAGSAMPPSDAILCYNLVASEYGLRSRLGYREWCRGMGGAAVRTLLSFKGSAGDGSKDKLFACTVDGVYDVTSSSLTPTLVFPWPTVSANDSGWCNATSMVTAAGHFLLIADKASGYCVYTESTNAWAQVALGAGATEVSGIDPTTIAYVAVWKNRVWLVPEDSASGWYLSTGAIYGAATQFNFGQKMKAGGHLVGLWNWTVDGGSGIDDQLVAISSGGDVLIYQGTDPSDATKFLQRGVWFLGGVPTGRRIATDFGGDLLILSVPGLIPLSRLVGGVATQEQGQYATAKIANLFNVRATARKALDGWAVTMNPEDNSLLVLVPTTAGADTEQLAMSLATKGWSQYRDLPMLCATVHDGKLYFGTSDGRACIHDGYQDNITLDDATSVEGVEWSLLTSFQNLGNGRMKRVQFIRPTLLAESQAPTYEARARYKFDLSEPGGAPLTPSTVSDAWDTGAWDTALWSGSYAASQAVTGATGIGVDVAIAIRGSSSSRTTLVGMDVLFDQGGVL